MEDLARVSLKKAPLYVGVDDHKDTSTVEGLEQVSRLVSQKCITQQTLKTVIAKSEKCQVLHYN